MSEALNGFFEEYEYPADPTQADMSIMIDDYTQWLTEQGFLQEKPEKDTKPTEGDSDEG